MFYGKADGKRAKGGRVMAHSGDIQRGDTVRWYDYLAQKEREGDVIRCARDGTWADVRYAHTPAIFADVTHLTRRVRIGKLQLVRKGGQA